MESKNSLYKTAIYMRISKDDNRTAESESIDTQRKILRNFCKTNGFLICGEYTDDGYSGTNFKNRPAFSKLLYDIKSGNINLVITKDLSRLGRNTAETSELLDTLFPQKKVRFISVTENLDTDRRDRNYNLITPVYNFTNELYCADISNKIRSALEIKMKNGEYIGSFAPFGYKKDKNNKNRLIPDKTSAAIVKEIFFLAKNGFSSHEIAEKLNQKNVPTPSVYRGKTNCICAKWTPTSVIKILNNEVYLGHTLQGKTKKPSFKSKQSCSVPKKDWIIKQNTHKPLINIDTWETVRNNLKTRRKTRYNKGFSNMFSGIAKCADCGKNMSSAVSGKNIYLVCGGYKLGGKAACKSHRISYSFLCHTVTGILKESFVFSDNEKNALCKKIILEKNKCLSENILNFQNRREHLEKKNLKLLDDRYSGLISNTEFLQLFEKYKTEKEHIDAELSILKKSEAQACKKLESEITTAFNNIVNFQKLTPAILNSFIKRIDVHMPQTKEGATFIPLDIYLKFKGENQQTEFCLFV